MLAFEMDGQPLSRPHGAPARVVIPEMYGYKGVKWLTKMELVDHQPTGYWEGLGYDQNAWVGRSNGYGALSPAAAPVHAHRARRALGARDRVPDPARLRAVPLPAEPGGGRSAAGRS